MNRSLRDPQLAREVQTLLRSAGLYTAPIDGIFGPKSRRALAIWRVENGLDVLEISDVELENLRGGAAHNGFSWPLTAAEFTSMYGEFQYASTSSGLVEVLDDWASRNLAVDTFPFFGRLAVHRKIVSVVSAIGTILHEEVGDDYLVLVGCYNPRHKGYDPRRSLSAHAYAAAIDINWQQNAYGTEGHMHPKIVEVFEAHNAIWGGRWGSLKWSDSRWVCVDRTRLAGSDPMHFQFGRDW